MNRKKTIFIFLVLTLVLLPFAFASQTSAQTPNKRARNLAKQGDQLYNRRQYDAALQKYAEAIKIAPVFPKARFFKGYSHFRLDQFSDAVSELNLALEQGYPPLEVVSIRMEANLGVEDYDNAVVDANRAISLAPKVSYYHVFLGRVQIINGAFEGAIESLNRAIALGDKSADVNYYLALAYGGSGNYIEQGNWADKALQRGTANAGDCWYLLGDSQYRQKKYLDSVQSFKNAINAFKNDIDTGRRTDEQTKNNLHQSYLDLSDVYRNLNRYNDAIETAQEGLSQRPNDSDLHISLAWYYSLSGKFANAIVAGEKAVSLGPTKYMAHTNLCRAYLDEGEYYTRTEQEAKAKPSFNKAVTSCKRALDLEANDGESFYYLGRAYYYLGNAGLSDSYYKKSVPWLEKFTKENPNYSDGFYLLGNAYYANGQINKAIAAYQQCLIISPKFARVVYNLGYVMATNKNMTGAREQYNILLPLDAELAKKLKEVIKD